MEATPASGCAALACVFKRIPYLGLCLSDNHKELLTRHLIHVVRKEMEKSDSPLYEPGMVKSVGTKRPGDPDPKKPNKRPNPVVPPPPVKPPGDPETSDEGEEE